MRRILYGDILAAASVLRCVDPGMRMEMLASLLYRTHCADKFRKRFGQACAGLGDGTLASSCEGLPRAVNGFFSDPEYADCMRLVFEGILSWKKYRLLRGAVCPNLSGLGAGKTES